MKHLVLLILVALVLLAMPAAAQCVNPPGEAGVQIYNSTHNVMQYCNGDKWIGKAAPDLSLTARVRGSSDWIYTYLKSFYRDPARPLGWNNVLFPGASMPNVLWELQGVQSAVFNAPEGGHAGGAPVFSHFEQAQPGRLTPEEFNQVARDISNFLQYAAEPAGLKRQQIGVWVLLFLSVLTILTWLLKHEYWRDVH